MPLDTNNFTYKPRTKYRVIQNSPYMGKMACFTKRALYGHHGHPRMIIISTRSLDKDISVRYKKM
jgi:hypothetical protein